MNRRKLQFARSSYFTTGLIPMLLLGIFLTGCGKKTFPKPITQETPPQIRDLQVQVQPKGAELTWSIPDGLMPASKDSGHRFAVLRSELNWENRNCLECPTANQQEIQRVDPAYPQPASLEGRKITWVDASVFPQHAYRYQVSITDAKGRPLVSSNSVTARVVPPPAPLKMLGAVPDTQGILVGWKATDKDAKGQALQGDLQFLVERHGTGGAWEKLSPVPVKANSFLDPAVASNQTYDYRVTPLVLFEESQVLGEPSVIQNVKAPEALPPPPPGTVWAIPSKGMLEIQWTPSDGKVGGYHVYRREGKEIIRLTATPIQNPPYIDKAVKPNVIYFYAVSAVSGPPEQREGLLSKWAEIRNFLFEQ